MSRFNLIYNIDKDNLMKKGKIEDNSNDIKIRDNDKKLPDLIIKDAEIARKYITYLNRPIVMGDYEREVNNILHIFNETYELNYNLLFPKKVYYDEDAEEEIIIKPTGKDRLFHTGYKTEMEQYKKQIIKSLDNIKKTILKE